VRVYDTHFFLNFKNFCKILCGSQ